MRLVIFLICILLHHPGLSYKPCVQQKTQYGLVCVCNSSYCDTVPEWKPVAGQYHVFTTSKLKAGFRLVQRDFLTPKSSARFNTTIYIDTEKQFQKIIGWGGAFTDAAGININSLPKEAQSYLLESYFGPTGIEYSMGRVVVGASDFSTRPYTYADQDLDLNLDHFALQREDFEYKIPLILEANRLRKGGSLKFFASAWSAPLWMKTDRLWNGPSLLKPTNYKVWTDYFVKFFREYRKNGVEFWGMTTGNEPDSAFALIKIPEMMTMGWTDCGMNEWVGKYLGPTLRSSEFSHLKIMLHDDNRISLPYLPLQLENPLTMRYADGVAIHWYQENLLPDSYLNYTLSTIKDVFLLATEACSGFNQLMEGRTVKAVELGSWDRGVNYINSIFLDLTYRAGGWVDWNLALNEDGGPNYIHNFVDSPIIINNKTGIFYKQPMFYVLGHFSKFVVPDSARLQTDLGSDLQDMSAMAFLRPDNVVALVIFNKKSRNIKVQVNVQGRLLEENVEANSLNTVLIPL